MSTRKKAVPWYKRTFRWSQTNLTEIDLVHLVNLTGAGQWPAYVERALPSGKVSIDLDIDGFSPATRLRGT